MTDQFGAGAPGDDHFRAVWQQTLDSLTRTHQARDVAYLRLTKLVGLMQDTAVLAVPYAQTRDILETELREPVTTALSESLGSTVRIAVTVDETLLEDPEPSEGASGTPERVTPAPTPSPNGAGGAAPAPAAAPGGGTGGGSQDKEFWLNPRYTFESFVAGSSNRFAHAASLAVAESPARTYNPLFIYGESGLGKTHLLHAIGHLARNINPGTRVKYVNSEEFTNDFINSIRDERAGSFQRRYRDIDILLLDDVQFLQGKEQTVEEFFHTFNTLHNAEKQVVITSDQPPKKLSGFAERLRSRFEWGLLVDVQPPDLETRIAILRKKAAAERLNVPMEVLEQIASRVSTNIRELEGALIRVMAFASVSKQEVSLASTAMVLRDSLAGEGVTRIRPDTIKGEVARFFELSVDDLVGPSRSRTLVMARQMAMYLCRELTDLSLPKIGAEFGGRDHTTVMHAEKKIRNGMMERTAVYEQITELTNRIRRLAAG